MKNFLSILLVIVFTCIPMCSQAKNNEAKCVITMLDGRKSLELLLMPLTRNMGPTM